MITLEQVKKEFSIWNKKAFNNELPTPVFEIMKTRSYHGQYCYRAYGPIKHKIRISVYYDRPYEMYLNTLVHEMIHYWVRIKGIRDRSHGIAWQNKAAEINRKYPELRGISRCNSACGEVSSEVLQERSMKKKTPEYVMLIRFKDNKVAAGVIPSHRLNDFCKRAYIWNLVKDLKVVSAPYAETFDLRHMRTRVSLNYISEDKYNHLKEFEEYTAYK